MVDEGRLPRATVAHLLKDAVPGDMRCSSETRDLIGDCLVEFIMLLTMQANEVATRERKKTLLPQHVCTALEQLGFGAYVPMVRATAEQHREVVTELHRAARNKLKDSDLSQEELLRQQQEYFAQARVAYESSLAATTASSAPPPPQPPQ